MPSARQRLAGLLGPAEALGFSGGFRLSLISGRPHFARLAFELEAPSMTLKVSVR